MSPAFDPGGKTCLPAGRCRPDWQAGNPLPNQLRGPLWSLTCWRDGVDEVDFVVTRGAQTWAVEVKSGRYD